MKILPKRVKYNLANLLRTSYIGEELILLYKKIRIKNKFNIQCQDFLQDFAYSVSNDVLNSLYVFLKKMKSPFFPVNFLKMLFGGENTSASIRLAFRNYYSGIIREREWMNKWMYSKEVSDNDEIKLIEFLNNYITYVIPSFCSYETFFKSYNNPAAHIRIMSLAKALEERRGILLDIGSGAIPLINIYSNFDKFFCVDLSFPFLLLARYYHKIEDDILICAHAEYVPFSDNTFDTIVASEVLEHSAHPENMLKEIYRVLKPKGKAIITLPAHIVNRQNLPPQKITTGDYTHRLAFRSIEQLQYSFQNIGFASNIIENNPFYVIKLCKNQTSPEKKYYDEKINYVCPVCKSELLSIDNKYLCSSCKISFPVISDIPILLPNKFIYKDFGLMRKN